MREPIAGTRSGGVALPPADPVPYLIVYGPGDVPHLQATLLPALALQMDPHPRHVFLLNYLESKALFPAEERREGLRLHDVSDRRGPGRLGFGESINTLVELARPRPLFIVLNPDTVPHPDFTRALLDAFDPERDGIAEARQWPAEHPKEYDPTTHETPWASAACMLVGCEAFRRAGGFDPAFFLYCEDVDLSWRMWLGGYRVRYVPEAVCEHHTGLLGYATDRYYGEHYHSATGFLLLAWKYFGEDGERSALGHLAATGYPAPFHEAVIAAYRAARPDITPLTRPPAHPRIKLLGFNRYHDLRS